MKIFLVGLPGSGKSTIGKILAERLQLLFVDLDREIEIAEGKPVHEIFKAKSEDYFRELEHQYLKKWCSASQSFVMATGGGAPCFKDNMTLINNAGISVFLDVPTRVIAQRMLSTDLATRPLLATASADEVKDRLELLKSHRLPFYRKANISVSGDEVDIETLIQQIVRMESQR